MTDTKGYYSVVQFCPEPARAEAVNVGVLLFCPELGFIGARTRRDNDRVRRMFGQDSFDTKRLNAAKMSIEMRLQKDRESFQSLEDLEKFIASRGNQITLTPARSIRVSGNPGKLLDDLMAELVGTSGREAKRAVIPALDDAMQRPTLRGRVMIDLPPVEVPVIGTKVDIPYAYQNGVLNLVKPQVFKSSPLEVAERWATRGRLIHEHQDADGKARRLIVVSEVRTPEPPADLRDRITTLFKEFQVRVVWKEQIDAFAAEVEAEAH